jgi:hypothetical protein
MIKKVMDILHTQNGKYALSFILGVGLASLFRKACNDRNCIVFHSPPLEDVKNNIYQYDNKCYKFTEYVSKCNENEKEILIGGGSAP